MLPIAVAAVLAIFLTTHPGRRIAARLGIPTSFRRAKVDRDTRQYLLDACGGDRREMARRVEAERARFSEIDESALYRRAVRTLMRERGGPRDLDEPDVGPARSSAPGPSSASASGPAHPPDGGDRSR